MLIKLPGSILVVKDIIVIYRIWNVIFCILKKLIVNLDFPHFKEAL